MTNEEEANQAESLKEKKKKEREKQKERDKNRKKNKEKELQAEKEIEIENLKHKIPEPKGRVLRMNKTELEASSMTPESRALLDRQKRYFVINLRALAAEARINLQQNQCCACGKSLRLLTPFEKLNFRYCSLKCVDVN